MQLLSQAQFTPVRGLSLVFGHPEGVLSAAQEAHKYVELAAPAAGKWTVSDIDRQIRRRLVTVPDAPFGHLIVEKGHTASPAACDRLLTVVEAPRGPWRVWWVCAPGWLPPATLRSRADEVYHSDVADSVWEQLREATDDVAHIRGAAALIGDHPHVDATVISAALLLAAPPLRPSPSGLCQAAAVCAGAASWKELDSTQRPAALSALTAAAKTLAYQWAKVAATRQGAPRRQAEVAARVWGSVPQSLAVNVPAVTVLADAVARGCPNIP